MKLYNSMTRSKEEFIPLEGKKVRMYSCGPTVYNYFHIGNARPFIIFDTLRSYLVYRGYEVTFVQNFTDVDDKIINRAKEEGVEPLALSQHYIQEYFKDAQGLGIKRADVHPKVSETIPDIIDFIKTLVDKGFAYAVGGDVYFDTQKDPDYGKLSGQNLEELNLGSRIDINEEKHHPMDFVLWKAKKEGEVGWASPWGEGRPGWHIECSVMSMKYLGETIDIHSGGQDLIFPHHENEIAQSESYSGKTFARYWLHNGFLNIENEKMSKSLGNFLTVRDISQHMDLEVVRFFLLNAQYRGPLNFSKELLESAKAGMERLYNTKDKLLFLLEHATGELSPEETDQLQHSSIYKEDFIRSMEDDLNTADAIAAIFELARFINTTISEVSSSAYLKGCLDLFQELTGVLNIIQQDHQEEMSDEIEALIQQRSEAKKEKNFAKADEIREQLQKMGIELLDTRQGTTWKKIR